MCVCIYMYICVYVYIYIYRGILLVNLAKSRQGGDRGFRMRPEISSPLNLGLGFRGKDLGVLGFRV